MKKWRMRHSAPNMENAQGSFHEHWMSLSDRSTQTETVHFGPLKWYINFSVQLNTGTDMVAHPAVLSLCSYCTGAFSNLRLTSLPHIFTLALGFFLVMLCADVWVLVHVCGYIVTILFYYHKGDAPNFPWTRSYPVWQAKGNQDCHQTWVLLLQTTKPINVGYKIFFFTLISPFTS